jgi:transcriptional regulator with XRE-family HTH domain
MKLKIKELREEQQLTQRELAEKLGSAQRNISNWENGISEPDCDTIMKLSELFDVSIDELLGKEYDPPTRQPAIGLEFSILKSVRKLSAAKKLALFQFLKELESE